MIYNVDMAKLFFTSRFVDYEGLTNLLYAGKVEPKYEDLDNKYFQRDYSGNDKQNDYGVLVKKQKLVEYRSKSPTAYILRKEFENRLGFVDDYYYYIIQRKSFNKYWHRDLDLPKFDRKEGIHIPFEILKHIDRNNAEKLSEIVLVLEDGSTYYCSSGTILKFFRDQKMPLFVNAFGVMTTGLPKELFEEKWK